MAFFGQKMVNFDIFLKVILENVYTLPKPHAYIKYRKNLKPRYLDNALLPTDILKKSNLRDRLRER